MPMDMIFLLMSVAVALGAMGACFYFAKKDSPIYAVFFFLIAAGAFSSASDAAKIDHRPSVAQAQIPVR
jgi:hypothetical protein